MALLRGMISLDDHVGMISAIGVYEVQIMFQT